MEVKRYDDPGGEHGVGHPFGYDPYENRLVVGGPGEYHSSYPDMPLPEFLQGRVGPNNITFYDHVSMSDGLDEIEDWKDEIRNALALEHQRKPFADPSGMYNWTDGVGGESNWRNEWKFGSNTKVKFVNSDREHDLGGYGDRTPFLYEPSQDIFYVGSPGQYHESLAWDAGVADEGVAYGSLYHPQVDVPGERPTHYHEMDDYSDQGDWVRENFDDYVDTIPGESIAALREHLGMKPIPEENWKDWKFGKVVRKVPHVISLHEDQARLFDPPEDDPLPRIEEVYTGNQGHGMGHPWIFHPDKNLIQIGDPGSFHSQIARGYDPNKPQDYLPGRVDKDNLAFYHNQEEEKWKPYYDKIRKALSLYQPKTVVGENSWKNLYQTKDPDAVIPEVTFDNGWKFGTDINDPQDASQRLSAPSKVFIDDKGIPIGKGDRMRKFIYTPFDQSVTLNGDGEWFHRHIYENKYGRNWSLGDIGTNVFTGHIYPDNSVHWMQKPSDEERQLINNSLGGEDFNLGWSFK